MQGHNCLTSQRNAVGCTLDILGNQSGKHNAPVTNNKLPTNFDTIVQGPHSNRPVAVQFELWQFSFETPSGAFSWSRMNL